MKAKIYCALFVLVGLLTLLCGGYGGYLYGTHQDIQSLPVLTTDIKVFSGAFRTEAQEAKLSDQAVQLVSKKKNGKESTLSTSYFFLVTNKEGTKFVAESSSDLRKKTGLLIFEPTTEKEQTALLDGIRDQFKLSKDTELKLVAYRSDDEYRNSWIIFAVMGGILLFMTLFFLLKWRVNLVKRIKI
jgi:hypothetical protein